MPRDPAEAWPPLYPNQEGQIFAWNEAFNRTKPIVMSAFPRFKSLIRKTRADTDLVLELTEVTDELGVALLHGLEKPGKKRSILHVPYLEQSLDVVNCMEPLDRIELARILIWDAVANALGKDNEASIEMIELNEEPGHEISEEPYNPQEGDIRFEVCRPHEDPDFMCFFSKTDIRMNLREIYVAIIEGRLSEDLIYDWQNSQD